MGELAHLYPIYFSHHPLKRKTSTTFSFCWTFSPISFNKLEVRYIDGKVEAFASLAIRWSFLFSLLSYDGMQNCKFYGLIVFILLLKPHIFDSRSRGNRFFLFCIIDFLFPLPLERSSHRSSCVYLSPFEKFASGQQKSFWCMSTEHELFFVSSFFFRTINPFVQLWNHIANLNCQVSFSFLKYDVRFIWMSRSFFF